MKKRPFETRVPPDSRAAALLPGADFHDAWSIESDATGLCALGHFLQVARKTPRWVELCMDLRNRAGSLVGLKDLDRLSAIASDKPAEAYGPGDRAGIFTVHENHFGEALLGDDDKHLKVVLSVHRGPVDADGRLLLTISTIVHVKNMLGRLYMLPVKPMHKLIVPATLRGMAGA